MTPLAGLMLASSVMFGLNHDDTAGKEYAGFEGVWRLASVEVDGAKQPQGQTTKVIISNGGRFVVVQGSRVTRGTFTLDPAKTPKCYDQVVTHGPAKGRKFSCIYQLNEDSYKLCGSFRGGERPTAFETKEGSGLILQVLNREKQTVKEALIELGRKELAGTWQSISYALDGKKTSDEDLAKIKLTFDSELQATSARDDQPFIAAASQIDPTAEPMTIDFTYTLGDLKGKTALGIYKIEDDVLTICRSGPGKPRPTEFRSTPGSGLTLMSYKRVTEQK
jgi:uncharacterized protein (TIGR03067 family)